MLYRKNLPGWERAARALGGAAMIACGFLGLPGMPIGYLIAGAGVVTAMTGFFGFCPMCAMAGKITVVEVEEIVETGALDPDAIHTPGIFVQRIVLNAHPEKRIEQRVVRAKGD